MHSFSKLLSPRVLRLPASCVIRNAQLMSSSVGLVCTPYEKRITLPDQIRCFRSSRVPSWRPDSDWWQKVVGIGAAGYTLVKLKGLSFALPLLKLTKAGPALSMIVSMGAYGMIYGWGFGAGMVYLLFVHELGHAAAMRHFGVPVGPMTFIPFIGAVVEMKGRPVSAYEEAYIALAGPLIGTLATTPFMAFGLATGSQFALGLAHWGCMINLLNLLPIGSLDGGRVAGALSKFMLPPGLGLCGALIAAYPSNPLLYLVFLSGGWTTYSRFFGADAADESQYYSLTPNQRVAVAVSYAGLIAFIASMMAVNDKIRKTPQEIKRELKLDVPDWERQWSEDQWRR